MNPYHMWFKKVGRRLYGPSAQKKKRAKYSGEKRRGGLLLRQQINEKSHKRGENKITSCINPKRIDQGEQDQTLALGPNQPVGKVGKGECGSFN